MTTLEPGQPAPAFDLLDADDHPCSLASFAPGAVIVYFYPAALTPGCTIEAIDFSARLDDFAAAGYRVVGISPDKPEKLARFVTKHELSVTLLSDPDRGVIEAFGAWGSKTLYGKAMQGVIRSTFVVDVDDAGAGTVRLAQYNVKASGHVGRLAAELGIG